MYVLYMYIQYVCMYGYIIACLHNPEVEGCACLAEIAEKIRYKYIMNRTCDKICYIVE